MKDIIKTIKCPECHSECIINNTEINFVHNYGQGIEQNLITFHCECKKCDILFKFVGRFEYYESESELDVFPSKRIGLVSRARERKL